MFITLEDETGIVNLVVWPKVFEKYRRTILSAGMIGAYGRIQREGEVVHLVAHRFTDLSANLASVGERDATFPLPHGRDDQVRHGEAGPDPRELPPRGPRPRNIVDPYGHIDQIKVKTRDFRKRLRSIRNGVPAEIGAQLKESKSYGNQRFTGGYFRATLFFGRPGLRPRFLPFLATAAIAAPVANSSRERPAAS
jgi:hypothetical protein